MALGQPLVDEPRVPHGLFHGRDSLTVHHPVEDNIRPHLHPQFVRPGHHLAQPFRRPVVQAEAWKSTTP